MENAAEALKLAFAVFVFVIALSVCISNFSLARETADIVLTGADETAYYEYEDTGNTEYRVVGLETIIPTIYKYNKENYTIRFRTGTYNQDDGTVTISGSIELYKSPRTGDPVSELDLNEERKRSEPWTGSNDEIKKFLDCLVEGNNKEYNFPDSGGKLKFSQGLVERFSNGNKKFFEMVGTEKNTSTTDLNKTTSKKIITYVQIN